MGQLVQRLGRRSRAGFADHRGGAQSEPSRSVRHRHRRADLFLLVGSGGGWSAWFNVSGGRAALGSKSHGDRAQSQSPRFVRHRHRRADLFLLVGPGGGWSAWFNVSGGAAALGSPITAIARNPNHLDLFVTGTDGRIYSCWWDQSGGWSALVQRLGRRGGAAVADHGGGAQSQSPRSVRHRHRRADLLLLVGPERRLVGMVQRLGRRRGAGRGSRRRTQSQSPRPVRHRHRRTDLFHLVGCERRLGQLVQRVRRRRGIRHRSRRSHASPTISTCSSPAPMAASIRPGGQIPSAG